MPIARSFSRPTGENFGKYLKVGVVEDEDVKNELATLCRFFSKNHGEDFVSFDEYVADMKVRAESAKFVEAVWRTRHTPPRTSSLIYAFIV